MWTFRGVVAVTVIAGMGGVSWTASASAADDPAPTQVTVAWTDGSHASVRVTWEETGAAPNHVVLENTAGQPVDPASDLYAAADGPNQLNIPVARFPKNRALRIGVYVGLPGQPHTSAAGRSAAFDTQTAPDPVLGVPVSDVVSSAVAWRWTPQPMPVDGTPSDPLDLPLPTPTYMPQWRGAHTGQTGFVPIGPPITETEYSLSPPAGSLWFRVRRTANEWGEPPAAPIPDTIHVSYFRALIPGEVAYGTSTVITGDAEEARATCDTTRCAESRYPSANRLVLLQARDSSGVWYHVISTRTDAQGRFRIVAAAPGTRAFQVVLPETRTRDSSGGSVLRMVNQYPEPGILGQTSRVYTRVLSARFLDPTAVYGQKVTASLAVVPARGQRATLQYRDTAGVWRSMKWVYLSPGQGSYTFTAVRRGTTAYRFVLPPLRLSDEWRVDGVVSASFGLTVR
jgi:hypothetical protein